MHESFAELIALAASQVRPKHLKGGIIGDVGCALLADSGRVYTARCVLHDSNTICAERAAIAKMVGDGDEYRIQLIVAVWRDEAGDVYVIPPCGHCRQAMHEIDPQNIQHTRVILDAERAVWLSELLPYHDWWQKQPPNH
jgi:cytidine deaminase